MTKILIIDDDRLFVRACAEHLLARPWDIKACFSAEQAKLLLRGERFDAVLLDLMLPPTYSKEGLDLLRELRSLYVDTAVIMMTQKESGMTEIVAEAMRCGAVYFLDKQSPVFYKRMFNMLDEVIAERRNSIFLSHGHNELIKLRVKDYLGSNLKRNTIVLSDLPSLGLTVVEKLERASERCCFAVIVMTKDDEQRSGDRRARQNVVHELGFFQGKYGRQRVVLVVEQGVELFSNISGIVRIEFEHDHFDEILEPLRREIEAAFAVPIG